MIAVVEHPSSIESISNRAISSLEDWLGEPPDGTEWVDGCLIEKSVMNSTTGRTVARLSRLWGDYKDSSGQGGEVYVETPCYTGRQGRRPDLAYLPPDLVVQYGNFTTLPQSFTLIAEVVSPTDEAEVIFNKVNEYLQSGCLEVWLVLPVSNWVAVFTSGQKCLFTIGDVASTQLVLPGFSVSVDELLC